MDRLATLELDRFPQRVTLMMAASLSILFADFVSKTIAVELWPSTLLFNVSDRAPFGVAGGLALIAASSVLACMLPVRLVAVGAGLGLGGSLGNLASRRWWEDFGGAPDFIRFADGSTGNVADLAIVAGVGCILLSTVAWLATFVVQREPERPS